MQIDSETNKSQSHDTINNSNNNNNNWICILLVAHDFKCADGRSQKLQQNTKIQIYYNEKNTVILTSIDVHSGRVFSATRSVDIEEMQTAKHVKMLTRRTDRFCSTLPHMTVLSSAEICRQSTSVNHISSSSIGVKHLHHMQQPTAGFSCFMGQIYRGP